MGDKTGIEWTDATWNPIVGCSIVSPGCTNCYAMRAAHRFGDHPKTPQYRGLTEAVNGNPVWTGKVALAPEHILTAPLRWRKPRRIFVNSMGDLFHEAVPDAWIDRAFAVMALAPHHTFQVLTKRSKRMREYCRTLGRHHEVDRVSREIKALHQETGIGATGAWYTAYPGGWAFHNVWLGVSAERQEEWDERKEDLRKTPAAVRFASFEPLLGDIVEYRSISDYIDWAIVGGESGPSARPMHPDWARLIRDQCQQCEVPFFFKQWGEWIDADQFNPRSLLKAGDRLTYEEAAMFAELNRVRYEHQSDGSTLLRVGKVRAGRLLDGRECNEFPRPLNGGRNQRSALECL